MIATMKGCIGKRKQETENKDDNLKFTAENSKIAKVARDSQARKSKVRERLSEDGWGGFVKKELEAVETLMEFFRQVQLPAKDTVLEHTKDFNFTWGVKKRRSISFRKGENHPTLEPVGGVANSADVSSKLEAAGDNRLRGVKQPELKINSLESSKDFSFTDSRAESPNSPLPVLKDGCFRNYGLIVPKVEEDSRPAAFQRPSMLPADIIQPSFLISCKVEKDEQIGIAKRVRAFPSNAVKACRPISGFKRENALEDLDLSIMCKQSIEKDASELVARCENKSTCLQETLKIEVKPELSFDSASSDLWINQDSGGRHSEKQKLVLSENEKEARRLRRVQANRESARQTIRRKQILCEELAKRATELTLLNENMKQERAVLKQEILSLYDANCFLKQQCATIDIQGNCKVLSQPSADAGPSSPPTMHVPFVPLVGLPYQVYPWALPLTKAGGMKCDLLQAEGEKTPSSEKSPSASYANSVAFGFWLAMGANRHNMQTPLSSSSQSTTMIHTPDHSKSGSPLSHVPVDIVGVSLAGSRVENATTSSPCQGIGDVELAHVETSSQEQKMRPDRAPQFLNSVSLVTDTEVENISVRSSALQSGQNWQLTGSSPWDRRSRAVKPFGRQNQLTLKAELEKRYSTIERKEGDLLQGHQRQLSHFFARRDGAAITKAAEARRRRKKITRNKSLLRQRTSKS